MYDIRIPSMKEFYNQISPQELNVLSDENPNFMGLIEATMSAMSKFLLQEEERVEQEEAASILHSLSTEQFTTLRAKFLREIRLLSTYGQIK